jgi:hypothetical protein
MRAILRTSLSATNHKKNPTPHATTFQKKTRWFAAKPSPGKKRRPECTPVHEDARRSPGEGIAAKQRVF